MNWKRILILVIPLVIISACGRNASIEEVDNHDHESDEHTISITQWTERMELFMEFSIPIVSEPGEFIVHLTTLDDFKPVLKGSVTLSFQHQNGKTMQVKKEELLRDGIFTPMVELPQAGLYTYTLDYVGEKTKETFNLGQVIAYNSENDIPEEDNHHEHHDGEDITFLKEQQWKTEFQTAPARFMSIKSSVMAIAEVIPNQRGYAEIVSPIEGLLNVQCNQDMVVPGSMVKKGDVLAKLCPPLSVDNSWTERRLAYQRAKSEFERAKRLLEKNAISQRDFEEMQRNYLIHKSGYESLLAIDNTDMPVGFDLESNHYHFKSPIHGIVAEVSVLPGQNITPGRKLMTVIDPSIVWLKMNVFEKDYYKIGTPQGATLTIPGMSSQVFLEKDELKLLSKGYLVDPDSRTIPILFEITNPDRIFKVGQVLQVELYTSGAQKALCVPEQAVYDEDVQQVIFVQVEGETFEKRVVKVGPHFHGWVAINDGLEEGEQVVNKGGYQVKLASMSTDIGDPHVH